MAVSAAYASTPHISSALVSVGDTSRTAPTSPVTILTAGSNGSRVDNIDLTAVGPVTASMVRLFVYNGTSYSLIEEVPVVATTPSATVSGLLASQYTGGTATLPVVIPVGSSLVATISSTQVAVAANPTSICAAQSAGGTAYLNLNGASVVAGNTTAISPAVTQAGPAQFTLSTTPYVMTNTALVSLTSTGNVSTVNFTVVGTNAAGALVSEVIAGPNANTVYSVNAYASVVEVYCSAAVTTATSIGFSSVYAPSLPAKVIVGSYANLASNPITIVGTSSNGLYQSETIASGPNDGYVISTKLYASLFTVFMPGISTNLVTVGNSVVPSGVQITCRGGDF